MWHPSEATGSSLCPGRCSANRPLSAAGAVLRCSGQIMAAVMNMLALSTRDLLAGVACFGVVASLWGMGLLVWRLRRGSRSQRVEQRLGLSGRKMGEEEKQASQLWRDTKAPASGVAGTASCSACAARPAAHRETARTGPPRRSPWRETERLLRLGPSQVCLRASKSPGLSEASDKTRGAARREIP